MPGCDADGAGLVVGCGSRQWAQLANVAQSAAASTFHRIMKLLLLEALLALVVFVAIVWWTMFSGRRRGERKHLDQD